MFLFGSSKEDKKPAMRGEDCSQMKRDVDGMDRFLQQVIDGDYTARAPQAHSPEMQRLGRKMEQLLQKQRDDLRSMLMTLNESVYDSTEVSEALNAIVTENIHVSARIDEMHKVVESLANEIWGWQVLQRRPLTRHGRAWRQCATLRTVLIRFPRRLRRQRKACRACMAVLSSCRRIP